MRAEKEVGDVDGETFPQGFAHPGRRGSQRPASRATDGPPPSYLTPKRPRRAYADHAGPAVTAAALRAAAARPATVPELVAAALRAHALDWSVTQRDNYRGYLLSPTGRFQEWCRSAGVTSVDALTTDAVTDFLTAIADRRHGAGLMPSTVNKFRVHLRAVARFQAQVPGYGSGLADIHRIPAPRMPKERLVFALTRDEEARVLAACTTTRDRLVIELLLATGLRVSEAAGLLLPNVLLTARPPRVVVVGSVHDPDCTKSRRPRQVPFRRAYATLPRRLLDWIANERDPEGRVPHQHLFLSAAHGAHRGGSPLGIWGYEQLCERLTRRAGVHVSPHLLRHTWATRLVNDNVQPMHLMAVGGWSSIEMVRRYYTPTDDDVLAAIAAAGA